MAARIGRGEAFVWTLDGRPVSLVAFVPTTAGDDAGRINSVFTPHAERNHGYAQAAVAALSRELLARGWRHCLIFADARNPITTHIYLKIGYRVLGAYRSIGFA